jgi:hypothetical protein
MTVAGLRAFRVAALAVMVAGTPHAASADWQFTPFFGVAFKSNTTLYDLEDAVGPPAIGLPDPPSSRWNFGGAVTAIGRSPIGAEAYFVYLPGLFNNDKFEPPAINVGVKDSRVYALMGNVVLAAPLAWNEYGLRPFISGGLGLLHAAVADKQDIVSFNRNVLGYNVGGGAVGFLSNRAGVRFDLRYIGNLERPEELLSPTGKLHLRFWTGSLGIVLKY